MSAELQLPEGWTENYNSATGQTFYVNEATGETSFDPPAGTQVQASDEKLHAKRKTEASQGRRRSFAVMVGSVEADVVSC